eukprot:543440-Amorphochlora_amoeboformis.AAC.1
MLGATVASLGTYGLFRHGIQALEVKEGIKRGSVASAQIYNGAFGLIADPKYVRDQTIQHVLALGPLSPKLIGAVMLRATTAELR